MEGRKEPQGLRPPLGGKAAQVSRKFSRPSLYIKRYNAMQEKTFFKVDYLMYAFMNS
jgi:hypothetical protein